MYMIKWIDNGIEKSIVAESWIERDEILFQMEQYNPTYEIL